MLSCSGFVGCFVVGVCCAAVGFWASALFFELARRPSTKNEAQAPNLRQVIDVNTKNYIIGLGPWGPFGLGGPEALEVRSAKKIMQFDA